MTKIDLSKNTQKEPWFLEINPNGRIPALTDTLEDGTPIRLFESGSIMQYLVDRYDTEHKVSYPHGTKDYYEVNNWVSNHHGSLGVPNANGRNSFSGRWAVWDRCKARPTTSPVRLVSYGN